MRESHSLSGVWWMDGGQETRCRGPGVGEWARGRQASSPGASPIHALSPPPRPLSLECQLISQTNLRHAQAHSHALRAAKYAAVLAMAGGADPAVANRESLMRALRGFVLSGRRGVERRRRRARDGSAQAKLQDLPDFALVFLVFILAEHPDLPRGADLELLLQSHGSGAGLTDGGEDERAEDEDAPCTLQEALEPFAHMFQVGVGMPTSLHAGWILRKGGPRRVRHGGGSDR